VGGGVRVGHAAIGDTVNTPARVEAATRPTGDPGLIAEATRARLPLTCSIEMVERNGIALPGKQAPARQWAPLAAQRAGERAVAVRPDAGAGDRRPIPPAGRGEPVAD
jgi:class 3 adenylate cyclase